MLMALCLSCMIACKEEKKTEKTTDEIAVETTTEETIQPVEIADNKYSEMGKKSLDELSKGDMDAWMSHYADNAKYYWNSGDSLVGKAAIDKYWRNRRGEVIESITFENQIWLPIKVNDLENVQKKGNWLLGWYKTTAKYKGGKSMTQWIHTDFHFDEKDRIDEVNQYLDRQIIK